MPVIADLLALAVIAACAVRGFMRGLTASLLGLLGVAVSFFASWLLWGWAGRRLNASFGLPSVHAYALGALLVFLGVYVLFSGLVYLIRWRNRAKRAQAATKPRYPWADKLSGAALGACFGILAAAMLAWLYNVAGLTEVGVSLPDIRTSAAGRLSGFIVQIEAGLGARAATNSPALAGIIARSARDPKAAVEDVERIKQNPELVSLIQDAQFTGAVLRADREAIKDNPRLNRLLADPAFVRSARDLRLLPAQSETVSTQDQAADQLARVGLKMARIKSDPQIQDVLRDGAIQKMLDEKDFDGLVQDERVWKLAGRVMQIVRSDQQ